MKKRFLILTAVLLLVAMPLASAADVWQMAESDRYGQKVGGMLGRGLLNCVTCFVDILVQTVEGTKKGPPLLGTLTGLGGGIGCTSLRALSGALDVATFWVPGFNGFPVNKSYANCLLCEEQPQEIAPAPVMVAPQPSVANTQPVVMTPEPVVVQKHDAMRYVKK